MSDAEDTERTDAAPEPDQPATLYGCPRSESRGQVVIHPTRETYLDAVKALTDDGYTMCVDLTVVDYLALRRPRRCPPASTPERFEVVVNFLDIDAGRRIRVRVQVPADDPTLPTLFDIHPGTEAMEREAYDMFGITFTDHPDLVAHPHARGLGGPPAAQGLRGRHDPGAVQGSDSSMTDVALATSTRRSIRPDVGGGAGAQAALAGHGQGADARARRGAADERGRGGPARRPARRTPTRTRR